MNGFNEVVVDKGHQFVEVERNALDDILIHAQNEVSKCTVCLNKKEAQLLCIALLKIVTSINSDK